ncbi:MAG TPA: hypothetical protein VHF89_13885 [Solirubrobacteraceae bacterium]|nr:hypothetical protein [Solirubrobacteraceae bacterium]
MIRLVLLVVATLAAVSPAAAAASEWREAGTAAGPLVGDGSSVAWTAAPGRAVVVRGGERLEREAPADCPGFVRAVAGSRVLFACDQREPVTGDPRYFDYAIEPDGVRFRAWSPNAYDHEAFEQLGDGWVAGGLIAYHVDDQRYYNYRTGDTILASRDPFGRERFLDPSFPALARPLCRPLRRRSTGGTFYVYPRYFPVQVADRWLLEGDMGTAELQGRPLRLRRCGARRARSVGEGVRARIGSGWMTWTPTLDLEPRGFAKALRLRDGRVRVWDVGEQWPIAHTSRAIYASAPVGPWYDPAGYRILRGSLR